MYFLQLNLFYLVGIVFHEERIQKIFTSENTFSLLTY